MPLKHLKNAARQAIRFIVGVMYKKKVRKSMLNFQAKRA